jgi:ISXO2-like transposase domain
MMTDDSGLYRGMCKHFQSHDVVKHLRGEYVRRKNGRIIHTNTAEGFFSILKRGIVGTFHHVSKRHLHRYLSEFDFRYHARDIADGDRAILAVKGIE